MNGIYLEVMATGHIQRLNAEGTPSQQVTGLRLVNLTQPVKNFAQQLLSWRSAKDTAVIENSSAQELQTEIC